MHHPLSTYRTFSAKLIFLNPPDTDTHMFVCVSVSGGLRNFFFGKFCVSTKWMMPNGI